MTSQMTSQLSVRDQGRISQLRILDPEQAEWTLNLKSIGTGTSTGVRMSGHHLPTPL